MTLLGIELSDAGILAYGGNPPRLLEVDGKNQESPGVSRPWTGGRHPAQSGPGPGRKDADMDGKGHCSLFEEGDTRKTLLLDAHGR